MLTTTPFPVIDTTQVESVRDALKTLERVVDLNGRNKPAIFASRAALLASEARVRRLLLALPAWCPAPAISMEYLHSSSTINLTWQPAPDSAIRIFVGGHRMSFVWTHGEEADFEKVSGDIDTNLALPPALFAILTTAFGQGPDQRMAPNAADADSAMRFGNAPHAPSPGGPPEVKAATHVAPARGPAMA